MHFEKLRNSWNEVQNRLGYIDQFEKKHGHRNPNSTDVHSLRKVKNLAAYFIKYMTKSQRTIENSVPQCPWAKATYKGKNSKQKFEYMRLMPLEFFKIDGKLWDCSLSLKTKQNCEMILETEALATWSACQSNDSLKTVSNEFSTIIFLDAWEFNRYVRGSVRDKWEKYLSTIRNKIPFAVQTKKTPAIIDNLPPVMQNAPRVEKNKSREDETKRNQKLWERLRNQRVRKRNQLNIYTE
jgi:hypothetical protein